MTKANVTELTAAIVARYVSSNEIAPSDIPGLMSGVYSAFANAGAAASHPVDAETPKPTPAQVRKSIQPDYLVSFIDGKHYRSIKRHLTTRGYTVESYKAQFGLPADYPTICPNYSKARSEMAKASGLGSLRGRRAKAKI